MFTTLWLVLAARADPTSEASRPPPPSPPVLRPAAGGVPNVWERREGRARRTFAAGLLTGAAGAAMHLTGVATRNPELERGGVVVEWIGAPIAAGGSLRSARAIREQGGAVSSLAGGLSWALWGTGMVLTSQANPDDDDGSWSTTTSTLYVDGDLQWTERELVAAAGFACTGAAYLAAMIQSGANGAQRRALAEPGLARPHVTVAPWVGSHARGDARGGTFGVALVGVGGI
jgi:hypothetical protein